MTYGISTTTLNQAVAASGTFDMPYPAGLAFGSVSGSGVFFLNDNDIISLTPAFGAASITVTNSSGATLPAGSRIMAQFGFRSDTLNGQRDGQALNVKVFGAAGDGESDDTSAIQSAANVCAGDLLIPPGVYKVSGPVILPETVERVIAYGATIIQTADRAIFFKGGTLGNAIGMSTVQIGAITTSVSAGHGIVADDWIWLRSGTITPNVSAGSRAAMLRRVRSVTETVVRWDAPTYRLMDTTVSMRKVTLGKKVVFEGGTFTAKDQTNKIALFEFVFCHAPDFNNITIRDHGGAGIKLTHCVGGSFNNSVIYNLLDDEPNEHYGYGVALAGSCRGFQFLSGFVGKVRHGITTLTSQGGEMTLQYDPSLHSTIEFRGEPEACYFGPVYVYNSTNAAFDCHEQGYGITITPNAHGCFEGVHIRTGDVVVNGGQIINCRRHGIRVDFPSSNPLSTVTYKIAINDVFINNIAIDGLSESTGINVDCAGADVTVRNATIRGCAVAGIRVIDGAKISVIGGEIDGVTQATQIGIKLESSNNVISGVRIRNTDIGIDEATGLTGNAWSLLTFENNGANFSRVPTYQPAGILSIGGYVNTGGTIVGHITVVDAAGVTHKLAVIS